MADRALTVKQPWADLIMAGVKDVENRSWPVPSTLPKAKRCERCGQTTADADEDGLFNWCSGGVRCEWLEQDGPSPFRLGIHAAAQPDTSASTPVWSELPGGLGRLSERHGALLGTVEVTGCHDIGECERKPGGCSSWAQYDQPAWHWTLADPQPLDTPIPMKGALGLWRLPAEVTA